MSPCSRQFSAGDVVSARYAEGQWYLASVEQCNGNDSYLVSWFDGDTLNRTKALSEMRRMRFNRETQAYEEDAEPTSAAEAGRDALGQAPRQAPVPEADAGAGVGPAPQARLGEASGKGDVQLHAATLGSPGGPPRSFGPASVGDAPKRLSGEHPPGQIAFGEEQEYDDAGEEEEEATVRAGDRVQLVGLQTRPELSNLIGTAVELKGSRWRVNVDGVGHVLLQVQNLRVLPEGDEAILGMEEDEAVPEMEDEVRDLEEDMVGEEEEEMLSWDGMQPGAIVRLVDLRKPAWLNGMLGTLIERKEEGWMVQVQGHEDCLTLGLEHLRRVEAEDDTYGYPWDREFEPPPFYMYGSWDDWAGGHVMNWDAARSCAQLVIELGSEGQESFRILIDGDLDQQLHPDTEHASIHDGFQILGPGKNDDSLNWSIGDHPLDEGAPAKRYEVRLFIGRAGFYKVDWFLLGKYEFGKRQAPLQATDGETAQTISSPVLMPNRATIKTILQAARPTWSWTTVESVIDKLARVRIESGVALIEALKNTKNGDLNSRLKAHGEKVFTEDTLKAIYDRGLAWETDVRWRENAPVRELDMNTFRFDDGNLNVQPVLNPDSLPVQTFKVVSWKSVFVRERPSPTSAALGRKELHDEVRAKEQTFDGFVKLLGEPGWILRDAGDDEMGLGRVLEPIGEPLPLLISELAAQSGPQKFVVTRQGKGVVRMAPDEASAVLAFKHAGDIVHIEAQTYNGWFRVSPEEKSNGGWMMPRDPEDGQTLLRCAVLEDRQEKKRKLRMAREALQTMEEPNPDTSKLRSALQLATEAGMEREEFKAAEAKIEQLLRRQAKEQEIERLRLVREEIKAMLAGEGPVTVKTLQALISRAKDAGIDKEGLAPVDAKLQVLKKQEEAERKLLAKRTHLQRRIETAAGNVRLLRGCIHDGDVAGLTEEVATAERLLNQAIEQEKEAARNALRQRVEASSSNEKDLATIKAEATAAGFMDIADLAEKAIKDAAEANKCRANTHEVMLEQVTAAAASGDLAELKKARDAAKKAGIPTKAIGRAAALGQNSAN